MPKPSWLGFTLCLVLATLASAAAGPVYAAPSNEPTTGIQIKVLVDGVGDIHVLWVVPAGNHPFQQPGIWYVKYDPNGTNIIPPALVVNSTKVQSADMGVDARGNAVIVWAEDYNGTAPSSTLSLLYFNGTVSRSTRVLASNATITWPSVALDGNTTIYLVWTEHDSSNRQGAIDYGKVTGRRLGRTETIASYDEGVTLPSKARAIFDASSDYLHVAWGTSQSSNQTISTVVYAKLVPNGTVVTKLQVARFDGRLGDLYVARAAGNNGAFLVWRTDALDGPIYLSQISSAGQLVYLKQLSTNSQARYLAVSMDSQNNLYVLSYQPTVSFGVANDTTTQANVSYLQIDPQGDVIRSHSELFEGSLLAATVSTNGDLYAVLQNGLVRVSVPPQNGLLVVLIPILLGCFGFVGAFSTEEGRYRLLWVPSALQLKQGEGPNLSQQQFMQALARKPGLKLGETRQLAHQYRVGIRGLARMEKLGIVGSFRDGLSRRFYVREMLNGSRDELPTLVMLCILENPGIWEAQLAKQLGLSQQIVHYHLKKLRDAGVIKATTDTEGARKLYRVV